MCRNLRSPRLNRTFEPPISPGEGMCPIGLRIACGCLRILLSPCPDLLEALSRRVPARSEPGQRVPLPVRVTLLRRGRQHAGHDRDECDGQPEHLNWHGEEVEHRLSYLSVESRSREGDQHRPQSGAQRPYTVGRQVIRRPTGRCRTHMTLTRSLSASACPIDVSATND